MQASDAEHGHAAAAIILSVALLESAIRRSQYIRKKSAVTTTIDKSREAEYLGNLTGDQDLARDVEEVWQLRHFLAHNILWDASVYTDDDGKLRFTSPPTPRMQNTDSRLNTLIDSRTRRSMRLGLNFFPTRVWRRDAKVVFKTVAKALLALETVSAHYCSASLQWFVFRAEQRRLSDIIENLAIENVI